jgi:hypothetical protein
MPFPSLFLLIAFLPFTQQMVSTAYQSHLDKYLKVGMTRREAEKSIQATHKYVSIVRIARPTYWYTTPLFPNRVIFIWFEEKEDNEVVCDWRFSGFTRPPILIPIDADK